MEWYFFLIHKESSRIQEENLNRWDKYLIKGNGNVATRSRFQIGVQRHIIAFPHENIKVANFKDHEANQSSKRRNSFRNCEIEKG